MINKILKDVNIIESVLKLTEGIVSFRELEKKLPKEISDDNLAEALTYLSDEGKILMGGKGVLWIK